MVVMQVDPPDKSDPLLVALAANALAPLSDLIEYVDVLPPKLTRARLSTIESARNALVAIIEENVPSERFG